MSLDKKKKKWIELSTLILNEIESPKAYSKKIDRNRLKEKKKKYIKMNTESPVNTARGL